MGADIFCACCNGPVSSFVDLAEWADVAGVHENDPYHRSIASLNTEWLNKAIMDVKGVQVRVCNFDPYTREFELQKKTQHGERHYIKYEDDMPVRHVLCARIKVNANFREYNGHAFDFAKMIKDKRVHELHDPTAS